MSQQTAFPDNALLWAKIREIYYLYVLLFYLMHLLELSLTQRDNTVDQIKWRYSVTVDEVPLKSKQVVASEDEEIPVYVYQLIRAKD